MSFAPYRTYKDSGVKWLGEVPRGWNVRRIRHLFEIRKRICGADGHVVLSITQQGIKAKDIESGDGQLSADYSKYQFVEVGEFAMNHMDLLTGYVDISSIFGVTSPDYRVFGVRDKEVCFDKYYLYLFQAGYKNKIFYAFGQGSSQLGRWRFPTDEFNSFEFPLPPISEQREIATFLDRETAKIDALIAEQERLIDLLDEKRQAVISQAVTKGLNPAASMKDSGVEWMGRVPAHWDLGPLKRTFNSVDYGISDSLEANGEIAVLRMGNIGGGKVIMDDFKYVNSVDVGLLLKEGDLLYNRTNSLDLIGKVGLFAGGSDMRVTFASYLVRLRTNADCVPGYFGYMLNTAGMLGAARANAIVAIGQCNLNPTRYGALIVVIPPQGEQQDILTFLDEQTSKLDALTAEANSSISLLQERRSALISAAVTGKIDVRGFVGSRLEEVAAE